MTPADELRAAAQKIRDLATRTTTTLERHEVQWPDLTVSDTAAQTKARPMVWSQYAAAMHPGVGTALAAVFDAWARMGEMDPDLLNRVGGRETVALARQILGATP